LGIAGRGSRASRSQLLRSSATASSRYESIHCSNAHHHPTAATRAAIHYPLAGRVDDVVSWRKAFEARLPQSAASEGKQTHYSSPATSR